MQALEGRPTEAISRPSPSSDENLLARSRQKDGALVTACTERHFRELPAQAAGEGQKGMPKEGRA